MELSWERQNARNACRTEITITNNDRYSKFAAWYLCINNINYTDSARIADPQSRRNRAA
jgi:hypothetical protein